MMWWSGAKRELRKDGRVFMTGIKSMLWGDSEVKGIY